MKTPAGVRSRPEFRRGSTCCCSGQSGRWARWPPWRWMHWGKRRAVFSPHFSPVLFDLFFFLFCFFQLRWWKQKLWLSSANGFPPALGQICAMRACTEHCVLQLPGAEAAQCDYWRCQEGKMSALSFYRSHLVYEWTTGRLQRLAHILRQKQPATGLRPGQVCSQCTLERGQRAHAARWRAWKHGASWSLSLPRVYLRWWLRAALAYFASNFLSLKKKKKGGGLNYGA